MNTSIMNTSILDTSIMDTSILNTPISTKLAALAVALMMNILIIGAVAYLFNGQLHQATFTSLAHSAWSTVQGAV